LGCADDLELEVNLAPKNPRPIDERATRRIAELSWRLIGLGWNLVQDPKQRFAHFLSDQSEMLAHFIIELQSADAVPPFPMLLRNPDRLVRRVAAKKPLPENLSTLLWQIRGKISLFLPAFGIGDPTVPKIAADGGIHPSRLYGII
jgi:hypothetical protein